MDADVAKHALQLLLFDGEEVARRAAKTSLLEALTAREVQPLTSFGAGQNGGSLIHLRGWVYPN